MRNAFTSPKANTVGPYSHAVDTDGLVFLSGQTPVDPTTGKLVNGDIKIQTRQTFVNLFAVLAETGLGSDDVQKVNVFLTDINDFAAMNVIYKEQFNEPYPARTTLGVTALPLGAQIEIEIIAKKNKE